MGILDRFTAPADRFRGLAAIFLEGDDDQSVPAFVLKLVRAVRAEDTVKEETGREVYEAARSRRRRLGLLSFTTGPLVPVATEVTDLYCETATVCDLVDLHRLGLSDEEIGAHLLLLWDLGDDLELARAAMADPYGGVFEAMILQRLGLTEAPTTRLGMVKMIWKAHGELGDFKENLGTGAVKGVVFTGRRAKKFIRQAEEQLGVAAP